MLEIQPVLPSLSVVKSHKIKRDDSYPEKQQPRRKKQKVEELDDAEPMQHIDEIV